jgi:hypothetical protein
MKTAYLLPCQCGRKWEVDAGQAGTQIDCSCGQKLAVPSVRGLRHLEVASAAESIPERTTWSPTRGAVFSLGLFVAVAALLFSGFNGYWFFITRRVQDPAKVQLTVEAEHIDHLSPVESMFWFRQEEREGLGDPSPPEWTVIDKQHESSRRWGIAGLIVAGAGLLATAGSMVGRSRSNR